jgi:hypothetical protein
MHKLAQIARESERFLRSLANDLGITTETSDWLARDLYSGSAGWTSEHVKPVDPALVARYVQCIDAVINFDPETADFEHGVSARTYRYYADIGRAL